MNILFLTIGSMGDIEQHALYTDLLRQLRNAGHSIYSVSPHERRTGKSTEYSHYGRYHALKVKTGNLTKCGLIEKGISTLLIEMQYKRAIDRYLSDVKFDLVLYSTPPITLVSAIEYVKKRDGAKSYLLLKDIFPQNAVDLGMMSKTGLKGMLYWYFRCKEKKLYSISDRIGCMSQANCDYVIHNNPYIDPAKVEVCPNAIEIRDLSVTQEEMQNLRLKYKLPLDKKIFVYGGNLGKPQDISHLIRCLKAAQNGKDAFFLIVGSGTEAGKLRAYVETECPQNMVLLDAMPKLEYDAMIAACDVGLIFLDYRFTIPNFPSRLLAYQQAELPVLACTDPNTDVGTTVVEGGFGWWCPSNDSEQFADCVREACMGNLGEMRANAKAHLQQNYAVEIPARIIDKFMNT